MTQVNSANTSTISLICKKRLLGEMKLLKKDPLQYIDVAPDEKDLLTWHFLIKGPDSSEYSGGYFIGKIMHSPEYPLKPPDFMMLTPNGRFDTDKKICLSNSGYHSSEWSAMWNLPSILTGFLSIMLDDKEHGISHIHYGKSEREQFAKNSIEYNKINYLDLVKRFTRFIGSDGNPIKEEKVKENQKEESKILESKEVLKEIESKEVLKETESKEITRKRVIFNPDTLEINDFKNTEKEYHNILASIRNRVGNTLK